MSGFTLSLTTANVWKDGQMTRVKRHGSQTRTSLSSNQFCTLVLFGLTHSGLAFTFLNVAQSGCFTAQSQSNQLGKKSYYRIQVWYNQFNKSYFLVIQFHLKYFVVNTSANHITTTNTQIQTTRWLTGLIELIYIHSSSPVLCLGWQLTWPVGLSQKRLYPDICKQSSLHLYSVILLILRRWIKTVNDLHSKKNKFMWNKRQNDLNIYIFAHRRNRSMPYKKNIICIGGKKSHWQKKNRFFSNTKSQICFWLAAEICEKLINLLFSPPQKRKKFKGLKKRKKKKED